MKRQILWLTLLVGAPELTACTGLDAWVEDNRALFEVEVQPPPAEHVDKVGTWTNAGVTLTIGEDGMLSHERASKHTEASFRAPITEWHSDYLVAGVGPFRQTFAIDRGPTRGPDGWTMTVNEVTLRRAP